MLADYRRRAGRVTITSVKTFPSPLPACVKTFLTLANPLVLNFLTPLVLKNLTLYYLISLVNPTYFRLYVMLCTRVLVLFTLCWQESLPYCKESYVVVARECVY